MSEPEYKPVAQPARVPAAHGISWLMRSLTLIRRQPARLLFLAVLLQLILGLSQVPVLGILVILALPAFSAGLLEAFRQVDRGNTWPASVLFVPLTRRPANGRFLLLGIVMFALAAMAATLVMGSSDAKLDANLVNQIEQGNAEAIAQLDPDLILQVMLSALLAVCVSGTISFLAIPLIWFHDVPMPRALLLGLQGLQRNWKAFLVLGLGLVALLLPLILVFALVLGLAAAFGPMSILLAALVMLVGLLFQLVVLGTQYLACKDIFGPDENVDPPKPPEVSENDGQLLA